MTIDLAHDQRLGIIRGLRLDEGDTAEVSQIDPALAELRQQVTVVFRNDQLIRNSRLVREKFEQWAESVMQGVNILIGQDPDAQDFRTGASLGLRKRGQVQRQRDAAQQNDEYRQPDNHAGTYAVSMQAIPCPS